MATKAITHCIFDMDGLLLDTEKFYTIVQKKILEQYGKEFSWDLKAKMMGKKALEAAQILVDDLDLKDILSPEHFLKQREEMLDGLFPTSELMPGAERLLTHLRKHAIPFCLATSSHKKHYDVKTTNHTALFSLFDHKVTGDQVTNGKPAPEIFLIAAARFNPPAEPSRCLVFEDAPTGVAAGKAAGMTVVMVPDPELDPKLTADADVILKSLLYFVPEQHGLPPFDD